MRVFVTGGTGAVGRFLLPQLIEQGHEVVALARAAQKAGAIEAMGAKVALADALDKGALTAAVRKAAPEVIIHQLTALAGTGNFKKFDEEFALTNRFRTEVTDVLLAAACEVGTRRFIAQSFCGWPFAREGGPVKTEEDPLDPNPPASFSKTLAAIRYLEDTVQRSADLQALRVVVRRDGARSRACAHRRDAHRAGRRRDQLVHPCHRLRRTGSRLRPDSGQGCAHDEESRT